MKKDAFSSYHPAVNFLYFALVISLAMFFLHPLLLAISLTCAFAYGLLLRGRAALRFNLLYMLPLLLLMAAMNPLFNHQGLTVLGYFRNGNPFTLESLLYGLAAAVMLVAVICWFFCYNVVMSSDKFVYLFGRAVPALSLLFSMTLRFILRFKAQLVQVSNAQKGLGLTAEAAGLRARARSASRLLSILVTWALEQAVDIADSMKSRGYGLPGRTTFAIYRFSRRDKEALAWLLALAAFIIYGALRGGLTFRYFPALKGPEPNAFNICLIIVYLALCLFPIIVELVEARKWKSARQLLPSTD